MGIDLHCHSTASDGVLTPSALVARAYACGVRLLAVTDHDTLEGLPEAQQAAAGYPDLRLVEGIELSCTWHKSTIHVLGFAFDRTSVVLSALIATLHQGRWSRAEEIARRLAQKGIPGALAGARAVQVAQGESANAPARPHFAHFLVEAGYVSNSETAFRKWLGAGKLGDVQQHWPTLAKGVAQLRAAGAWVSLAHPLRYRLTGSKRRQLVTDFVAAGGQVLEVVNGRQSAEATLTLSTLAADFALMGSVGSDFHTPSTGAELGRYAPSPTVLPLLADQLWTH